MTTVTGLGDDHDDYTLHEDAQAAVIHGKTDKLRHLLDAGLNIHSRRSFFHNHCFMPRHGDWSGVLLHLAARHGRLDIIQLLLERGTDIEARLGDWYGDGTPLYTACNYGQIETVRRLAGAGAELNVMSITGNALVAAYDCGDREVGKEIVRLLLERGANVNLGHYYRETVRPTDRRSHVLHIIERALIDDDPEFALELVRYGANFNGLFRTLKNCSTKHVDLLKLLIEHGETFDQHGETFDQHSLSNARVARLNPGQHCCYDGFPCQRCRGYHPSRYQSSNCWSISQAADRLELDCIDRLLESGQPIDRIAYYHTALNTAAMRNVPNPRLIHHLILRGANMHYPLEIVYLPPDEPEEFNYCLDCLESTTLHLATTYAFPQNIGVLLDAGADVNALDGAGLTPLMTLCWFADHRRRDHWGALGSRVESMRLLLGAGADAEYTDQRGNSALKILQNIEVYTPFRDQLIEVLLDHAKQRKVPQGAADLKTHAEQRS